MSTVTTYIVDKLGNDAVLSTVKPAIDFSKSNNLGMTTGLFSEIAFLETLDAPIQKFVDQVFFIFLCQNKFVGQ